MKNGSEYEPGFTGYLVMTVCVFMAVGLFLIFAANTVLRGANAELKAENTELKAKIRQYELFYAIVYCESTWRPYLKSKQGDLGLAQINPRWHGKRAKALGFNIRTPGGNIDYAFYLLGEDGTEPWAASQSCWEPKLKRG